MFLVQGRPTVTAMLKSDNPDGILAEIQELRKIGVDTLASRSTTLSRNTVKRSI